MQRPLRWLLFFVFVCLMATSCGVLREAPAVRTMSQEDAQKYSARLGVPLTGTEDPDLIREVTSWIGVPYRFGGNTRTGADCSGFIRAVYQNVYGLNIPRTTEQMARHSQAVRRRHMRPGDLVFFHFERRKVSHAGIYLGQGYFIHASSSRGVVVNSLEQEYYARRFARGARFTP